MNLSMIPTLAGTAAIANAAATGKKVDIAKFVFGDGNGEEITPQETMTELVNKLAEVDVSSVTLDQDTKNQFTISGMLPSSVGGFFMREIGIVSSEDVLLGVGRMNGGYKPLIEDNAQEDIYIRVKIAFSKPDAITIVLDPFVAQATQADLENLRTELKDSIDSTKQELNKSIQDIKLYECNEAEITKLVGNDSIYMNGDVEYMTDADIDALFPKLRRED